MEPTEDSPQPTRALYSTPTPYQLDNYLGKYCQCGEEILDNICTEEQIISGCYDVSKNDEKAFLRSLSNDIDCNVYNSKLNGHKYSEVFNLGFDNFSNTPSLFFLFKKFNLEKILATIEPLE